MRISTMMVGAAALALTACGQTQKSGNAADAPGASELSQSAQTYSGAGKVTAIAGDQVSIAHGPISGIGWPAMTMTFTARGAVATQVRAGDQVSFAFRKDGSAHVLTDLRKR